MSEKQKKTEASAPIGEWHDGIYRMALRKPIPAHGEDISTLEIREPTGGDIISIGVIAVINDDGNMSFDMAKSARMLSRLSSVPVSSIERMAPNDLISATWIIAPFFIPN